MIGAKANADAPLVWIDGPHFVFMHRGREVWSCWLVDAEDAEMLLEVILPEKNWFTPVHRDQFAKLVAARVGSGDQ